MYGLKEDWMPEAPSRCMVLEDYQGAEPRWCPGCGDHSVLSAVQRLCRDEQLPTEKVVVVSGIGCASRFPHYLKTYGFHGLHGRPLPIACGVRSRRPDLNIFVATGDGDCCAIGTAHWIHAIRYNMKMVILMFDNNIYGLTKMQTSPTTKLKEYSNTHPGGVPIEPINPIATTLSITNASFVAQTVDWNPPHLYATVKAAWRHPGAAFVRILQRCPHFTPQVYEPFQKDSNRVLLMKHEDGIPLDESILRVFKNQIEHDPQDMSEAREIAARQDVQPIGLFYRNEKATRYDLLSAKGVNLSPPERIAAIEKELDLLTA